jgi:aspartyl-tRNA(Asn)/glutamyl-tRNA(Gln) amidotransferase subunit A
LCHTPAGRPKAWDVPATPSRRTRCYAACYTAAVTAARAEAPAAERAHMAAMVTSTLGFSSAAALLDRFRRGDLSPVEATQAILERIERLNPCLNAYLYVNADGALKQARAAEAAYLAGNAAPLAGLPLSIKDTISVRAMPYTLGSLLYRDAVGQTDAISVARLRAAGAVLLGKTNTPEFGSLATTENRLGDPARNPWDTSRTPGGSSGGAGAAIASGLGAAGIGTDLGGSVRIPAAMCGIFAIKATTGRVARDSSGSLTADYLAHEGPMARSVLDAALLLDVISGPHPSDRFSQLGPAPAFAAGLEALPRSVRTAWSPDLGFIDVDREVAGICERAVRAFEQVVGEIMAETPPGAQAGRAVWPVVANACTYVPARVVELAARAEDLTEAVRADLDFAERTSLAAYFEAVLGLRAWRREAATFFERFDLLLTPALPIAAPAVNATELVVNGAARPGTAGLMDFTAPFNATGQPAAVVPCGFTAAGLPVGLQIVGRHGDDLLVMQAARAFEQTQPWADRWPALAEHGSQQ